MAQRRTTGYAVYAGQKPSTVDGMTRANRIDRDKPAPLWVQVRDDLVTRIEAGELSGRLPSEFDLASDYGVGRDTVRHAVAELVSAGRLTLVRGVGTFVATE